MSNLLKCVTLILIGTLMTAACTNIEDTEPMRSSVTTRRARCFTSRVNRRSSRAQVTTKPTGRGEGYWTDHTGSDGPFPQRARQSDDGPIALAHTTANTSQVSTECRDIECKYYATVQAVNPRTKQYLVAWIDHTMIDKGNVCRDRNRNTAPIVCSQPGDCGEALGPLALMQHYK